METTYSQRWHGDTVDLTLKDRKDFMELPIEERRIIMEQSVEPLKEYYESEESDLWGDR